MLTQDASADDEAVVTALRRLQKLMVAGDTDALRAWLADDFTLTHMTGYVQSKGEWLRETDAGQFDYHAIDNRDVDVAVDGDTATVEARTVTDATVYGSRADWRLALALTCRRESGSWRPVRVVASTW